MQAGMLGCPTTMAAQPASPPRARQSRVTPVRGAQDSRQGAGSRALVTRSGRLGGAAICSRVALGRRPADGLLLELALTGPGSDPRLPLPETQVNSKAREDQDPLSSPRSIMLELPSAAQASTTRDRPRESADSEAAGPRGTRGPRS